MPDEANRLVQQRPASFDELRALQGHLARQRADPKRAVLGTEVVELRDRVHVDHKLRTGEAQVKQRNEALAAGEHRAFEPEQRKRLLERDRRAVVECHRLHEPASRSARHSLASVNGGSTRAPPSASATALATAAGVPIAPPSPIPFAPSGLSGDGDLHERGVDRRHLRGCEEAVADERRERGIALLVVDRLLDEALAESLGAATNHLSFCEQRVHDRSRRRPLRRGAARAADRSRTRSRRWLRRRPTRRRARTRSGRSPGSPAQPPPARAMTCCVPRRAQRISPSAHRPPARPPTHPWRPSGWRRCLRRAGPPSSRRSGAPRPPARHPYDRPQAARTSCRAPGRAVTSRFAPGASRPEAARPWRSRTCHRHARRTSRSRCRRRVRRRSAAPA